MARQQLAAALAVVACCLLLAPEARGQYQQRNNRQTALGSQQGTGQNQGVFVGPQAGQGFGQQGGAFGGGQQGLQRGPQFGPGQQQGFGQGNPNESGFVGNDAQSMRASFENMSGRQRRRVMFDMMVENLNEMRDRRAQRDQRRREPDPIRVQLRPSFNAPQLDSRQVAVTLQSNITKALDLQGLVAPRVELNNGTATVSGLVPSERERTVIERMIAMQPGVTRVENQLTVDPFAPESESGAAERPSAD